MESATPLPSARMPAVSEPDVQRLGRWWYPAEESLWAKLESTDSLLRLIDGESIEGTDKVLFQECVDRLRMAKSCLGPREGSSSRRFSEKHDMFWRFIHATAEDLLILMPREMLVAKAVEVEEEFKRKIRDPVASTAWLGTDEQRGPLRLAVDYFSGRKVILPGGQEVIQSPEWQISRVVERQHRFALRSALELVNEQTDAGFRHLRFAMLVRNLSGLLLVALFGLSWIFFQFSRLWSERELLLLRSQEPVYPHFHSYHLPPLALISLLMLGAGGAIVANMTSKENMIVNTGPTRRQLVYYLFAKPAIGAFAAFTIFLLAQSSMLFSLEVAPNAAPVVGFALGQDAASGTQVTEQTPPEVTQSTEQASAAPIRITLRSIAALLYALALISVAAGFSAERMLSSTMDQVMGRLFRAAEKTQAAGHESAG